MCVFAIRSLQHARMEVHYETNGAFMEEGQLLKPENIEKIKHIPCTHLELNPNRQLVTDYI